MRYRRAKTVREQYGVMVDALEELAGKLEKNTK